MVEVASNANTWSYVNLPEAFDYVSYFTTEKWALGDTLDMDSPLSTSLKCAIPSDQDNATELTKSVSRWEVITILDELSDEYRQVIIESCFMGKPLKTIAKKLGKTVKQVAFYKNNATNFIKREVQKVMALDSQIDKSLTSSQERTLSAEIN